MNDLRRDKIHAQFQLMRQSKGAKPFELKVATELPSQGVTAIFGHSGSGKTTFLRCVAGLERAQTGYLEVQGQVWQGAKQFLPTHKRPLGYVFQEASLFEHLTALGNLKFAMKRAAEPTSSEAFEKIVSLMGIESILPRYPSQLSGGERQRVAIARALLIQPRILLMDEPLASLDNPRKQEILPYLAKLRTSLDIPILYVSHSVDEIAQLADHVMVLEGGQLVAQGALSDVFARTDLKALSGFDMGAVWQGKVIERQSQWHLAKVACGDANLWVRDAGDDIGGDLRLRILARDVSLSRSASDDSSIVNRLPVTIIEVTPDQDEAMVLLRLESAGQVLLARLTRRSLETMQLAVGQLLWAQIKSVAIMR